MLLVGMLCENAEGVGGPVTTGQRTDSRCTGETGRERPLWEALLGKGKGGGRTEQHGVSFSICLVLEFMH